jgi:hypothetical protein
MFHASGPNVSDERRIGFAMRFIRPDTPVTGKAQDYAMLVRGCDRGRNRINVVPPSGSFTPAGLALYEEVLAVQSTTLAEGAAEQVSLYDTA